MKDTNLKKMERIGQPPGKRKMDKYDTIYVNSVPLNIYIDTEVPFSDYYLCHKQIQDLFGVRHDAGLLLTPVTKNGYKYPHVCYGEDISSGFTAMSTFINFTAYTIVADSQLWEEKQELKTHLFNAFKEYVDMKDRKTPVEKRESPEGKTEEVQATEQVPQQEQQSVDESKDQQQDDEQAKVEWKELDHDIVVPQCPTSFRMFDDDKEQEKPTQEQSSTTVPEVYHSENKEPQQAGEPEEKKEEAEQKSDDKNGDTEDGDDDILSQMRALADKASEKCSRYKNNNLELTKRVDELLYKVNVLTQTNEALKAQNDALLKDVRTCARPNNISTSCALYRLADSMTCFPIDVQNIVHNIIMNASVREFPDDKKYMRMWDMYNKELERQCKDNGIDLTFYETYKKDSKIITPEQKELMKKYGPMVIDNRLYEYIIKDLGYAKQALGILCDFINARYHDTSTIVDAVKRYFRIENNNAAIHWLHRMGVNFINYEE